MRVLTGNQQPNANERRRNFVNHGNVTERVEVSPGMYLEVPPGSNPISYALTAAEVAHMNKVMHIVEAPTVETFELGRVD